MLSLRGAYNDFQSNRIGKQRKTNHRDAEGTEENIQENLCVLCGSICFFRFTYLVPWGLIGRATSTEITRLNIIPGIWITTAGRSITQLDLFSVRYDRGVFDLYQRGEAKQYRCHRFRRPTFDIQ